MIPCLRKSFLTAMHSSNTGQYIVDLKDIVVTEGLSEPSRRTMGDQVAPVTGVRKSPSFH